jgi:hypothetical protein
MSFARVASADTTAGRLSDLVVVRVDLEEEDVREADLPILILPDDSH